MDKLIPTVNQLHDIASQAGVNIKLNLPQIAVIGAQSSGKSSVLENFVGKDFLPRGTGIVTRRPLVLQLIHNPEEYAEFSHCPQKKFHDFNDVRKEIEVETDRVTGMNNGISEEPINLKIYSPNVLNLTLIDLPGLTKVPIGDQPENIEQIIKEMIIEFITPDNCLILAVTPANSDLANSDALKLAKEVDPKGYRTIGVITKLDMMDAGTDAREILENKIFPLKRGYVGVINRSQENIKANKDIKSALVAEKKFFSSHPAYKDIAHRLGTPYLQHSLNQQLTSHIRDTLPGLRHSLLKQQLEVEKEVEQYKHFNLDDSAAKREAMLQMIQQLRVEFERAIGSYDSDYVTETLNGGSRINSLFHERFPADIREIQLDNDALKREITIAIRNIRGVRIGLFTPDMAFEAVVKKEIARLKEPGLKCISLVVQELSDILLICTERMSRYPRLREETEQIITSHVRQREKVCKEQLGILLEFELAYMNTKHEDFLGLARNTVPANILDDSPDTATSSLKPEGEPKSKSKEYSLKDVELEYQVEKIRALVDSYLKIVTKTIQDLVPKSIMYLIIQNFTNFINVELLAAVYASGDQLMDLSREESQKREELLGTYDTCKQALKIIGDVSVMVSSTATVPMTPTARGSNTSIPNGI